MPFVGAPARCLYSCTVQHSCGELAWGTVGGWGPSNRSWTINDVVARRLSLGKCSRGAGAEFVALSPQSGFRRLGASMASACVQAPSPQRRTSHGHRRVGRAGRCPLARAGYSQGDVPLTRAWPAGFWGRGSRVWAIRSSADVVDEFEVLTGCSRGARGHCTRSTSNGRPFGTPRAGSLRPLCPPPASAAPNPRAYVRFGYCLFHLSPRGAEISNISGLVHVGRTPPTVAATCAAPPSTAGRHGCQTRHTSDSRGDVAAAAALRRANLQSGRGAERGALRIEPLPQSETLQRFSATSAGGALVR